MPLVRIEDVRQALRNVIDPEVGLSVIDLGLVYDIDIQEDGSVRVKMTLTTPGCPMSGSLPRVAEYALARVPGVTNAEVELVWDPPWSPDRITEEGRRLLGWR
ncbi:metal-sulfur cluster assembly factor [Caldinitratiruptor microaerophilus]|uniref:MIP18 family-like domain-containing protein n=1 Tax=Caldinitratiruptor microaerophilus TaxID=671077 RepID=A0AA35CIA8_9FIRM|nr:metal-sulfur cluster assembly factor [Caldinitratiruptor microaerophilus]BDG59610.1 hypothetical protein caldi_07000 [Caldinitratiruptor microaerophilus]